jgi:two-component system, chemotaxis family, chemotaxis protein CheY
MAYNILIVDDSKVIRSMVERTIRMAGVPVGTIYMAENGKVALETLAENWIDIVMADLNMPVMDGVALVETMSTDEVYQHIPVVVVSTEGSETKLERLWNSGMKAFIRKPFTPEHIRDVMRDILGQWENEA